MLTLGGRFGDAGPRRLAPLGGLETLKPCGRFRPAGLRGPAGLTRLKSLDLEGAELTDEGVEALAGLKGLEELSLADTR